MKIIAYHGSQTSKLKMYNDSALYFTTSYEQAKSYAKREWDEGLIEGEIPVVYKAELTFNNPYKIENYDDFQMEFTDSNMNEYFREELIEKGYDSAIYNDRKSTLICIFYPSQYKILDIEKLPPSLDYYYNGELNDEDDDINDYYYENDYEDELNEVLKLSNIKLINEQKDFTTFQLPKNIPSNFFKITNSLKDIKNWKARILENNSGGEELKVGDYDEVGYVMISLKDNTIIPIARSDEHHHGYDIMYEIYESKYKIHPSNFYSVYCLPNSANYPYSKEEADKLKDALIKCDEYGMDLDTSKVYLKYIDSLYKNKSYDESLISARDFISGKYGLASFGETVSLIGEKLVDAFKNLSNTFENTNVRGDIPITQLKMAVKKLYTVGSRIQLPDKFKLINPLDLEKMMDIIEQYKSKYIDIQKLYKLFFGFNGFRNIFHQRLRKNIGNEDLNKQLGSVKVIIEMIGAI